MPHGDVDSRHVQVSHKDTENKPIIYVSDVYDAGGQPRHHAE